MIFAAVTITLSFITVILPVPRTQGWKSSLFKTSFCQELAFKPEDAYSKNICNPHPQRLVLPLVVTNPRSFNVTLYRLLRGCSSVGRASDRHAAGAGSISGAAREFSPRVNFQCRLSDGAGTPPCAVTCIYICVPVKDPVVHVRVRWIWKH